MNSKVFSNGEARDLTAAEMAADSLRETIKNSGNARWLWRSRPYRDLATDHAVQPAISPRLCAGEGELGGGHSLRPGTSGWEISLKDYMDKNNIGRAFQAVLAWAGDNGKAWL
jgi:hypothetical protein